MIDKNILIFEVSKIVYNNKNRSSLTRTNETKILNIVDKAIAEEDFFDYFTIKTFLVIELIDCLIYGNYDMATSMFSLVKKMHDKHNKIIENKGLVDYGVHRIKDYALTKNEELSNILTLKSPEASNILYNLWNIGYEFNENLLNYCDDNINFVMKL